jgi:hypothetical protein
VEPLVAGGSGGEDFSIEAMLLDGDRVHVGGAFTRLGGRLATHIATVAPDGTVTPWLGDRPALGVHGHVVGIGETADGIVVAGSVFAGDVAGSAAVFDGSWRPVPGEPQVTDVVDAAVRPDGTIVLSAESVTGWDGDAWAPISPTKPLDSPVFVDADGGVYYRRIYAGTSEVFRVHGGAERSLGTVGGDVVAFAIFDGDLVVAANVEQADATVTGAVLRLHHDDQRWRGIENWPEDPIRDLAVVPAMGIVVVTIAGLVATWDGATWQTLGFQPFGAEPHRLCACDRGFFLSGGSDLGGALLAFHDGAAWYALSNQAPSRASAMALTRDGLYLGVVAPGRSNLALWRYPRP